MRRLATFAAVAALAIAPAVAQNNPGAGAAGAAAGSFISAQTAEQWVGTRLMGTNVYGTQNERIGDVNDVVIDSNGHIQAVVVGVGGFLGIGEKNVAVPFKSLNFVRNNDGDRITMNTSKGDLENAPKFEYYRPARQQTQGAGGAGGPGGAGSAGGGAGSGGAGSMGTGGAGMGTGGAGGSGAR